MRRANTNKNNSHNRNRNRKRRPPPFLPPSIVIGDDSIAGRTRRQKRTIASNWDLQTSIIIEIISWLDQDSLMTMNVVSKQLYDIITTNEPGNKNKIYPVFEVSGSSTLKFYQNLHNHFLNKETKNKLQRYQIMRFKDLSKFKSGSFELRRMEEIQMNGITSLYLSSSSSRDKTDGCLLRTLPNILPKLYEVDFSNIVLGHMVLDRFSNECPLLEKVTSNNHRNHYRVNGFGMHASKNLKEINMNNSRFIVYASDRRISDLNNHHEIFMFHRCCKALERVSIRNMNWSVNYGDHHTDLDQRLIFKQNVLIKFVRNAPSSLHWFRSDLTPDNMTMLRMERPGIELLN
ncbi:hypothetical protein FRACYDRAFT_241218 [Fragilariopsis cylindrus CCMP1102]|uniref:F-box domain-containing protein n=1 Tax=Fragilariopsis cylindrus CCMP1102 TaxID=635003 RepID=A0A1E7F944_9STRA|nr:hypothetical protein FRACYDRAFT_241218 [Fragilariopsis cylindrus CCMP1102]|eukprot:OEU14666.1 hypothetical protein FRACYDRAFT_241218 [Fragilariopsis cylindrus CCMP1102]